MNLATARSIAIVLILYSLGCLTAGCGSPKDVPDYEGAYRRVASAAMALSTELEPLHASRLGITAADSLLFTYSEREIESALKRLKRLEAQLAKIPATGLSERDVTRATVVIDWIRGARFAFEDLRGCQSSPLLYCWTAEEALWGIPSRPTPPGAGEIESYRKRVLLIPALLSNGVANLRNPADWHVRHAIERLDSIAAGLPELAALIERRYGEALDGEIESARLSILGFRAFASDRLLPVSHGRIILGSENLSRIFGYDEHINTDPNTLIAEAEKQMKRLAIERGSIAKRIALERRGASSRGDAAAPATDEPLESRIERILRELGEGLGGDSISGALPDERAILAPPSLLARAAQPRKASYLSIPIEEDRAIVPFILPFSAPACRLRWALSASTARMNDDALRFALLRATPDMLEAARLRCAARDSIAAVFPSATFEEGWRYLKLQARIQSIKKTNPELYLLLLDDWIRKYARLVVVISVHTGTKTSDDAAQYLVETLEVPREEAMGDVLAASVSPAIAYPAISMILIEDMLAKISFVFRDGKPHGELAKLLRQWRDTPLPLIVPKTKSG
jgi:hypothetical protein